MGVLLPAANIFSTAFSSSLADVKANESCICGAGWRAGLSSTIMKGPVASYAAGPFPCFTFDVHVRCIGAVMYWDRKPWTAEGSASATSLACDSVVSSNPAINTASCTIYVLAVVQQLKN